MSGVRGGYPQPGQRPVPLCVPGVLRPAGGVGAPFTLPAGNDAGGDSPVSGRAWPGRDFGIRAPDPEETPLSWSEVHFAHERGLL
jgi:hypothetical protein